MDSYGFIRAERPIAVDLDDTLSPSASMWAVQVEGTSTTQQGMVAEGMNLPPERHVYSWSP